MIGWQTSTTRSPRSFVVCKSSSDDRGMCLTINFSDMKQVERSSSPNLIKIGLEPYASFQKTDCGRASTNGSPHPIRQLTITLRVILITRKLQRGSSKETFTRNGNQEVLSFGFTESVRPVPIFYPILNDVSIL